MGTGLSKHLPNEREAVAETSTIASTIGSGTSITGSTLEERRFPSTPATTVGEPSITLSTQSHTHRNTPLSRKIASVSQMLREMYSLDLKIFGMEGGRPEDDFERNAMIEEANKKFATVAWTLDEWEANEEWWTDEELEIIKVIRLAANRHDPRRHRKWRGNIM